MTTIEAFDKVNAVNQAVLQIARSEKPTGDYPAWAIEADEQLQGIRKEFMKRLRAQGGAQ